jgi:hypothetical protein
MYGELSGTVFGHINTLSPNDNADPCGLGMAPTLTTGQGPQHSRPLKISVHLLEILPVKHPADTAGMVLIQADGIANLIPLLLIVEKPEAHVLTGSLDTSGIDLVIQSIDCFKIIIKAPLYHQPRLVNLSFLAQYEVP